MSFKILLFLLFLCPLLLIFLIKWFVTLKVYPRETVAEFFQRMCLKSIRGGTLSYPIFLDPINQIRDCSSGGNVIDVLQKPQEYWDEENMVKRENVNCPLINFPFEDSLSIYNYNICPSYGKLITMKCPGELVFDAYSKNCVKKNVCFGKNDGDKAGYDHLDFEFYFPSVSGGVKTSKLPQFYFTCDGKNNISEYGFCKHNNNVDEIFDLDSNTCVPNPDFCWNKRNGTVHRNRNLFKALNFEESEYFTCVNQRSVLRRCPEKQFFNVETRRCQYIDRCKGLADKTLLDHLNPKLYLECISQEECVKVCPDGYIFDGTKCKQLLDTK